MVDAFAGEPRVDDLKTMKEKKIPWDVLERMKVLALRIVRLYSSLSKTTVAQVIGKQVLRSGNFSGCSTPGPR